MAPIEVVAPFRGFYAWDYRNEALLYPFYSWSIL
jgi:hypothetical protein